MKTSTDRELLELAAKAAGLTWRTGDDDYDDIPDLYLMPPGPEMILRKWNPLTDDGDALRLAVTLSLGVMSSVKIGSTCVWEYCKAQQPDTIEVHSGDSLAATRRAIVRAAAELGRIA